MRPLILGLGRSGMGCARHCQSLGIPYTAWDDTPSMRANAVREGLSVSEPSLENIDTLILSPGIPHTLPQPHPVVDAARNAGIPVRCDIDVLVRTYPEVTIIAVTGTNGKSTACAQIAHALNACGRPAVACGNIGRSVFELSDGERQRVLVLELSSYQLELLSTLPAVVAILLNITPDHLDRHGTLEAYAAAKERIFALPPLSTIRMLGVDATPAMEAIRARWPQAWRGSDQELVLAACAALGAEREQARAALAEFPGLPHRMEAVPNPWNLAIINDSKATNPHATLRALQATPGAVWIAGGRAKGGGGKGADKGEGGGADFCALEPALHHVAAAVLLGEAAPALERWLSQKEVCPQRIPLYHARSMTDAVQHAMTLALAHTPNRAVLLSPACASFDMFQSFEHRGVAFIEAVQAYQP